MPKRTKEIKQRLEQFEKSNSALLKTLAKRKARLEARPLSIEQTNGHTISSGVSLVHPQTPEKRKA